MTVPAFVLGTMVSGIYIATSRAFNPVDEKVNSPAETVKSTALTHFVQPKTVYVSDTPAANPTDFGLAGCGLVREKLPWFEWQFAVRNIGNL